MELFRSFYEHRRNEIGFHSDKRQREESVLHVKPHELILMCKSCQCKSFTIVIVISRYFILILHKPMTFHVFHRYFGFYLFKVHMFACTNTIEKKANKYPKNGNQSIEGFYSTNFIVLWSLFMEKNHLNDFFALNCDTLDKIIQRFCFVKYVYKTAYGYRYRYEYEYMYYGVSLFGFIPFGISLVCYTEYKRIYVYGVCMGLMLVLRRLLLVHFFSRSSVWFCLRFIFSSGCLKGFRLCIISFNNHW